MEIKRTIRTVGDLINELKKYDPSLEVCNYEYYYIRVRKETNEHEDDDDREPEDFVVIDIDD